MTTRHAPLRIAVLATALALTGGPLAQTALAQALGTADPDPSASGGTDDDQFDDVVDDLDDAADDGWLDDATETVDRTVDEKVEEVATRVVPEPDDGGSDPGDDPGESDDGGDDPDDGDEGGTRTERTDGRPGAGSDRASDESADASREEDQPAGLTPDVLALLGPHELSVPRRPAGPPLLDHLRNSSWSPSGGPRSTRDIIDALRDHDAGPEVVMEVLAPFPVIGPASYTDDFHAPRHVPTRHLHQGTDIFAARGTPVIAVAGGTVTQVWHESAVGGNALRLAATDGTVYYYAHLDRFWKVTEGQEVTPGQLLGFVGDTGNARGTPPHLHFEVRPSGGPQVSPLPTLDGWLADARAKLDALRAGDATPQPPTVAPAAPMWRSRTTTATGPVVPPDRHLPVSPISASVTDNRLGDVTLVALLVVVGARTLTRRRRRPASPDGFIAALPPLEPAWTVPSRRITSPGRADATRGPVVHPDPCS